MGHSRVSWVQQSVCIWVYIVHRWAVQTKIDPWHQNQAMVSLHARRDKLIGKEQITAVGSIIISTGLHRHKAVLNKTRKKRHCWPTSHLKHKRGGVLPMKQRLPRSNEPPSLHCERQKPPTAVARLPTAHPISATGHLRLSCSFLEDNPGQTPHNTSSRSLEHKKNIQKLLEMPPRPHLTTRNVNSNALRSRPRANNW